jgi:hypothetical protein
VNLIHEPWKLNMIEQQFYDCEIGKDYPAPIVNIEETRRYASDCLVSVKDEVKEEEKILKSMFLIRIGKQKKQNLMTIFLKANWENIIMANYEIDPKILLPFLPKGVSLIYNGKAYMSLVGFMFKKIKLFNVPILVWQF